MSDSWFSRNTPATQAAASWATRWKMFAAFGLIASLAIAAPPSLHAQMESVFYSFPQVNGMSPYPYAGVVRDAKGNMYGTTWIGGASGSGTVYKVSPQGVATILYSFTGGADGANPIGALVRDASGNLYGTTNAGGANGVGAVFELSKGGTETVLHSFARNGIDGWGPWATLLRDKNGNLYGTAEYGGANGGGTVFELTPEGTETLLYSFGANATDGYFPNPELVRDANGNFYGTTYAGGVNGVGTVFKLTATGTETVLHSFANNGLDGYQPGAGVVRDGQGNVYGTTINGGPNGQGAVFRLSAKGVETVLLSFNGFDGVHPYAALVRDKKGNLYGTAAGGGLDGLEGYGSVFELVDGGVDENVLHIFAGGTDGGYPYRAALVLDSNGNLYGTTIYGGANLSGTIYKVVP